MDFALFFNLMPFLVPLLIAITLVGRNVIEPYMNGMKQVDPLKYPTLHRTVRIIRANNTKAREIEAKTKLQHFDNKRLEVEKAIDKAIEAARKESQDKHLTAIYKWDTDFAEITREREEQARREKEAAEAKARAEEEAARAEIRERELAIWTANEKSRLARFEAEQRALQAEEDRKVAALLEAREMDIQALSKHRVHENDPDNRTMHVIVHSLYVRKLPTKDSRIVDSVPQNSWVSVNGWIAYETVYGNPIWFRLANGQGWVWSGGLNSQSTVGLEDLNHMKRPGETFITKSADGMIHNTYTCPSELQGLIDAEMEYLKREKQVLEAAKNPYGQLNANVITADRIQVGEMLQKIYPSESMTVDQVASLIQGPPRYNDWKLQSGTTNFWRGTEFENM